jgi:phage tail sheath gpL-like
MAFYRDQFIQDGLLSMMRNILRFEYQLNNDGSWHSDATVNSKKIEGSKVVCMVNIPNNERTAATITAVRFFDMDNEVAGEKTISLSRTANQTGLIRFDFPLTEE